MTKRQFVVLAFRLYALYLVFNLLTSIGSYMSVIRFDRAVGGANLVEWIGLVGLSILGFLFVIWLFWAKSEWLMERILAVPVLQETPEIEIEDPSEVLAERDPYSARLTPEVITQVAFSVIGLFAALQSLPRLLRDLQRAIEPFGHSTTDLNIAYLLPEGLTLSIGVWLFLRPWQWQQWVWKLRMAHDEDAIA